MGNIPADFRVSLIKAMASDLIDALLQVPNIASITVVGIDHQLLTTAANPRLTSYPIAEPLDINSDLQIAIGEEDKIAIFLPDLPSVSAQEISLALEIAAGHQTSFMPLNSGSVNSAASALR